jgi:ATP-dependent DNA ligase
VAANHLSPFSV